MVVALSQLLANRDNVYFAQILVAILVSIWGVRLSYHIARRNLKKPEDKRYVELRKNWRGPVWLSAFLRIFAVQAVLMLVISLPIIAVGLATDPFNSDIMITIGFAVWAAGFATEAFADRQLRTYLQSKRKGHKVMDEGLWAYSRHPNYFGEVTLWWGIWIISLSINPVWWSVIGPLTITGLILFVSGVPMLEKRYATDRAYQAYARRTSKFVPWFPKKTTS